MPTQQTGTPLSILVSIIVPVVSLIFAGIIIYLNYKERKEKRDADYRQAIYSKQVETYAELLDSIDSIYHHITTFLAIPPDNPQYQHELNELTQRIIKEQNTIRTGKSSWWVFMDNNVGDKLSDTMLSITQLMNATHIAGMREMRLHDPWQHNPTEEYLSAYETAQNKLNNEFSEFIKLRTELTETIREALHIERLNEKAAGVIGKAANSARQKDAHR